MAESTIFHSHLSSIMQKLVISAVTEINKLMTDYCAVLRFELTREKQDNSMLRDKLREKQDNSMLRDKLRALQTNQGWTLHQPANDSLEEPQIATEMGNNVAGLQLYCNQRETCGWWNSGDAQERILKVAYSQTEPVAIKHERIDEEADPEEPEMKAAAHPPTSPLVSQQQHAAKRSTRAQAEWQFHSQPSERSKELHKDNKQSVESQDQFSLSVSLDQLDDVGLPIKREPESPDLHSADLDTDPSVDLGFEFHQGALSQRYPNSGAVPLESGSSDPPGPGCYQFFLPSQNQQESITADVADVSQHTSDGDTSHCHGSQTGSSGSYASGTLFRATRASECINYVCQDCGKGFPFLSTMKRHRLLHTGERTQHCGQCGMSFIRRCHLRRHELLHTGLRPFACQICSRRFSRSAHLNTHMKTHQR